MSRGIIRLCCAKQETTEQLSLADDVRFHPPAPNDVIMSACQRYQQFGRQNSRRCQRRARTSTKKVGQVGSVRAFVCASCSAAFVDRATLVRHVRVHTGQRPYSCPVCSRAFTQSGNLARHIRAKHSPPVVTGNHRRRL